MPDSTGALETHMPTPEELAELADTDTHLGTIVSCFPATRLIAIDIRADKAAVLRKISTLIEAERHRIGCKPPAKRGPAASRPSPRASEVGEFLRKAREYHIVRLWDWQLAGAAKRKLETAAALYLSTPTQIMTKSEKRKLLLRIATAQSLQAEADDWVETLRASGLG